MKKESKTQPVWKDMFLFTKDGKLQNMDLMYSLFLGVGILFLNFIIGNRITIFAEEIFPEMSRAGKNLLDILIPAIICGLAAFLLFRIIRKKKIVLMAYCTALLLVIIIFVILLFEFERETLDVLLPAYTGIFIVPALAGTVISAILFRFWTQSNPDPSREEEASMPPEPEEASPEPDEAENISAWRQFRS